MEIVLLQVVPLKTGLLVWRKQERILFHLVSDSLNAHSFRRCWKWDPCESIHFCTHRYTLCKMVYFSSLNSAWNVLPHETFRQEPTVSKGLRPARSPDLSMCDFYLGGGYLKDKVYESNYRTIKWSVVEHSKRYGYRQITILHKVYLNMLTHAIKFWYAYLVSCKLHMHILIDLTVLSKWFSFVNHIVLYSVI